MSETSETKWQGPYETDSDWSDHGRLYFSRGKEVLYLNNKEDQAKILAALNEPAASGPGLTPFDRHAINEAIEVVNDRMERAVERADSDAANRWQDVYDRLHNLLARDAKADTVTVRREVLEALHDCTGFLVYYPNEATRKLIAEAEAALAEGGK